jgi:hypothetical protein
LLGRRVILEGWEMDVEKQEQSFFLSFPFLAGFCVYLVFVDFGWTGCVRCRDAATAYIRGKAEHSRKWSTPRRAVRRETAASDSLAGFALLARNEHMSAGGGTRLMGPPADRDSCFGRCLFQSGSRQK